YGRGISPNFRAPPLAPRGRAGQRDGAADRAGRTPDRLSRMVDAAEVAVVTGAAGGLGRLIAEALADHGRALLLIDRIPEALDETRRRLEDGYDVHVGTR